MSWATVQEYLDSPGGYEAHRGGFGDTLANELVKGSPVSFAIMPEAKTRLVINENFIVEFVEPMPYGTNEVSAPKCVGNPNTVSKKVYKREVWGSRSREVEQSRSYVNSPALTLGYVKPAGRGWPRCAEL